MFWRHGHHAKGIVTMLNDFANAKVTMPKAWRPSQRYRDHTKGIGTLSKAWRPFQRHGDLIKGMVTLPKVW